MIAASRHTGIVVRHRMAATRLAPTIGTARHRHHQHHQRCLAAKAGRDDKSWGEIAAEAADVVKSVAAKVAGGASAVLQRVTQPKQPARQQQQPGDVFGNRDGRPLPVPLPGGGLLGGLVGGLVNSTLKGLADQLEQSAAQSRSLADRAAARIQGSARVKQRLGEVTVGLPLSQSTSTSSINGRRSSSVSLVLPVYNNAGALLAQASVSAMEGPGQDGSCRIAIRMPTGDTLVLDDDDDDVGSSSRLRSKVGASPRGGEVIDAEFRDLN